MAHGFSEKAMRDQELLMRKYVDLLLEKLHGFCKEGKPVVLSDWYNYTTFDIIGDLAFGEPFDCLAGSNYDEWIAGIFQAGQMGTILQSLSFYPWVKHALLSLVPQSIQEGRKRHKERTSAKMARRMQNSEGRPDLIEGLLRKKDELVRSSSCVPWSGDLRAIHPRECQFT
jgi:hypothetical protein